MPFDVLFNSKLFIRKSFDHSVLKSYNIPKGLKQKWKIPEERGGLAILEFGGQGGDKHFGISEGKGGLKYSCHPW